MLAEREERERLLAEKEEALRALSESLETQQAKTQALVLRERKLLKKTRKLAEEKEEREVLRVKRQQH